MSSLQWRCGAAATGAPAATAAPGCRCQQCAVRRLIATVRAKWCPTCGCVLPRWWSSHRRACGCCPPYGCRCRQPCASWWRSAASESSRLEDPPTSSPEHTSALAGDARCSSSATSMLQLGVRRLARGSKCKRHAAQCCPVLLPSPAHAGDARKCSSVLPAPAVSAAPAPSMPASFPCATSLVVASSCRLQHSAACCSLLPHAWSARAFALVIALAAASTCRCRQPREAPCCAAVEGARTLSNASFCHVLGHRTHW